MVARLVLVYVVLELMALVGLAGLVGVGWALLALSGSFVFGIALWAPLAGRQLSAQLMQLRSGLTDPGRALGDGALTALASGLVLVPGLVTTALGLMLLLPPVRAVARPGLTAIAMRRFAGRVPLIADARVGGGAPAGRDYIDGEVIDVWDEADGSQAPATDPRALPNHDAWRT